MAYPYRQFDIKPIIKTTVGVIEDTIDCYPHCRTAAEQRNAAPTDERDMDAQLHREPGQAETCYDMKPGTPVGQQDTQHTVELAR